MSPKILHIVGDSKYGGGSVLIERLADRAMDCGYEVSVLTTDGIFKDRLKSVGVDVVDMDCIWRPIRPLRDLVGCARLCRYLHKNCYDIVHTHTSKAGFVGRLAARVVGVPIIIHTVHGFSFHEQSSKLTLQAYSFLERIAAYLCDAIVTVSFFHCDQAKQLKIGNHNTRVAIPNGINPDRVKPTKCPKIVRAAIGVENDEIMCLSTGRLARQKGFDLLIHALKKIPLQKKIKVVIAGDGELGSDLKNLVISLNLQGRVLFLGFRSDLADLLHSADLVALPSRWEGLSISLLEAMAAGKAIITSDISSNLEVTRNGKVAKIVHAGNSDELADVILDLISDKYEIQHLGRAALEQFQHDYTEDLMLRRYMDLYNRLLREKSNFYF